jgi:hypothetical protein
MDAEYYRRLARELVAEAKAQTDPATAARIRERGKDYWLLAEALDQAALPPSREQPPQPAQQQQQVQSGTDKDKDNQD